MKSRLIPLLCLALFLTGCGGGRSADVSGDYLSHLRPARWERKVVFYRIHGGPAVGASTVRRTIRTGIHNWDRTFDGILTFREATGTQQEDVSIRFVPVGSLGGDFFGRQQLGRTIPVVVSGRMVSATVLLDSQLWARLPTLEKVAAHEGLHFMGGNEGHSPYTADLGNPDPPSAHPNSRDTRTMRLIYGF